MSLLSTSRFPHLKFVIQIPGLSKPWHFHSTKQQPPGVIFRFLAEYSDSSNNVNGKKKENEIIIVVIIIVISINLLLVYRESMNLIGDINYS
mgnify:CR=1 FL=1